MGDAEVLAKADGATEVRRYVSGMTQLQVIQPGVSPSTKQEYLLTDALGSTHRIVDAQGDPASGNGSKQAFATFGERANADDRSTLTEVQQANFNALLPRGYTGHQQADEVGVVHMNGRIYDPRLGRFLQADSMMEDIFDPQAINSYSYVRNNPMNATDPTGHWRAKEQGILRQVASIVITIATGVHVNGILTKAAAATAAGQTAAAAALTAQAATYAAVGGALSGGIGSGSLKGALIGALGGLTFQKIGLSKLGDTERIFAHALAGGTLEVLGGGKFGHGFVSAGLSKALSPLADTDSPFRDGLVNAAIGGTVSEIRGGDFANGALMAATQYAFNALAQAAVATADPYSSIPEKELNDPRALRNGVKSFNESLTEHQEKLRLYRDNPMRHDNKGGLRRALEMKENGRFLKIYNERIYELNRQMADIRMQIGQRVERLIQIGELQRPSHIPTQVQPPAPLPIRLFTRVGVLLSTLLWSSPAY